MKIDKVKLSLIIVIILLVIFIVGILVIKPAVERRDTRVFNQGIQFTITTIMQEVSLCNIVPLIINNQTIEIIAIDCLTGDEE